MDIESLLEELKTKKAQDKALCQRLLEQIDSTMAALKGIRDSISELLGEKAKRKKSKRQRVAKPELTDDEIDAFVSERRRGDPTVSDTQLEALIVSHARERGKSTSGLVANLRRILCSHRVTDERPVSGQRPSAFGRNS